LPPSTRASIIDDLDAGLIDLLKKHILRFQITMYDFLFVKVLKSNQQLNCKLFYQSHFNSLNLKLSFDYFELVVFKEIEEIYAEHFKGYALPILGITFTICPLNFKFSMIFTTFF
jgi:hypothetical protein